MPTPEPLVSPTPPPPPLPFNLKVVLAFSFFGFVGGLLTFALHWPSVICSLLFGTGVASLVYGFLGGITKAEFVWGVAKFGGSMAALLATTFFLTHYLENERTDFHLTPKKIVGTWYWDYGQGGWHGELKFSLDPSGNLVFQGNEKKCISEFNCTVIYTITDGHAEIVGGDRLKLDSKVHDAVYNRDFEWQSVQPFGPTLAFMGDMQPLPQYGITDSWGLLIMKRPY
jgi:hypothetical protein